MASHIAPAAHIGMATEAISAAVMIVSLSRLGMDDSLTRFYPGSKNPGGLYNALIVIMVLVTILVTTGFIIGLPYISPALLYLNKWQFSLLFIGYIFLTSVCDMQGTALVAIRRADLAFLQYSILILRVPLLFALGSLGIFGIFLALDVTYLIMMVVGIILLYKMGISRDLHVDFGEVRKTVVFSLGSYSSTIISTAPVALIPILIANVAGVVEEAYFFMAYAVATFLFMVPDSIGASMFVEGSHERPLRDTAFRSLKFALALMIPMVLAIMVFGDRVLLLFSPAYSAAAHQLLLLLAISSLFYAVIAVYITVTQVQKNMVMLNFIKLAASGSTIGFGFILLLKQGLMGIGYAWLLSNAIVAAIAAWMMLSKKKW